MKVSIITATIGRPELADCIESIRNQTYKNIEHIVVVDGQNRWDSCDSVFLNSAFPNGTTEHILMLPYPTGTDRYNGHRIYGGATYFANGDFHLWLDDDNILEPDHVQSLVDTVTQDNLDWAYSLRKIVDMQNNFLCLDDCESLGKWPSILHPEDYFIDVNCFFVRKELAVQLSPVWYRKFREPNQMEVDRALTQVLLSKKNNLKFACTNNYSVRYRVGNTGMSVKADFFLNGNKKMLELYSGELPWKK